MVTSRATSGSRSVTRLTFQSRVAGGRSSRRPGAEPDEQLCRDPMTALPDRDDVLIRAKGLTKTFGGFVAVDGIEIEIRRGEAFGFLGPNGAGKSSTMRMIGCVSPLTGGELTVFGLDPIADGPAIRAR